MNEKQRRRAIRRALNAMQSDRVVLTEDERHVIHHVLSALSEGYDPRPFLGIKPARGKPPQGYGVRDLHWVAVHYWALRWMAPKEKDLVARKLVSDAWGQSSLRVYKTAIEHRALAESFFSFGNKSSRERIIEECFEQARKKSLPLIRAI
jgi:hypothetical protein